MLQVYYMTGGLQQWMANGWETVDSDQLYECSLPPMAIAGQDIEIDENEPVTLDGSGSQSNSGGGGSCFISTIRQKTPDKDQERVLEEIEKSSALCCFPVYEM
ncbi:MAG: hypothetical protein ACKVE4_10910 [Dissulfuribacterales bacterium]